MPGPVLLIHDDISVIAPVKRVLQKNGIDSLLVTNAADAVITFGDLAPDVVVLAPEVDGSRGEAIYQEIRLHPRGADTKFVLLGRSLESAPDAPVLELPLDGQALLDAVNRAFVEDSTEESWLLQEPSASEEELSEPEEEDEPDPWRVPAPPEDAPGADLATSLFGDLPEEEPLALDGGSIVLEESSADPTETLAGAASVIDPAELVAQALADEQEASGDLLTFDDEPEVGDALPEEEALRDEIDAESRSLADELESEQSEHEEEALALANETAERFADEERERVSAEVESAKSAREALTLANETAERLADEERQRVSAEAEAREAEALRRAEEAEQARLEAARRREEEERQRIAALEREARAQEEKAAALREQEVREQQRLQALREQEQRDREKLEALRQRAEEQEQKAEALREQEARELARLESLESTEMEERERLEALRRRAEEQEAKAAALREQESLERRRLEELLALEREEQERLDALAEQAAEQQKRAEALRRREAEEQRRLAELEKRNAQEQARLEALRAKAKEVEQRALELKRSEEAEKRRLQALKAREEEERERLEALKRMADEQRERTEALLRKEQEEKERLAALKAAADEEAQRLAEEKRQLEEALAAVEARRLEAQRQAEEERQRLARLAAEAEEEERRAAEERAAAEQKAREREEARAAALRAAEEEKARQEQLEKEKLEQEKLAQEKARQRLRAVPDPEPAGEEEQRAREEQLLREQQARREEQEEIRRREETAPRRGPRMVRPFAAGRWRGATRNTEQPPPDRLEETTAAESGEETEGAEIAGFISAPPARPTLAPFPPRGTLAELDAPSLVCQAWEARLTGRVDVAGIDAPRTLWFEEGRLVAAASGSLVERLEDVALRAGLITRAQHHALRISDEKYARRLAIQMVELGYIRPAELYPLVRRHVEEIAWSLFADEESSYVYTAESAAPEERVVLPLHPYALATEGIRRKFTADRLYRHLGGPATLLRPRQGGPDLGEFGFSAREKRLASRVDGLRTLEELLFEGGIEEVAALKVFYALLAAGAVEIAIFGQAARPRSAADAAKLDLTRVNEKYAQVVGGDYFQILGLRRDATAYEVREAWERLSRDFNPDRFIALDDPQLHARLQEIGRALGEAHDVLSDDAVREEYARNLIDEG